MERSSHSGSGEYYSFLWPPRSYTCSFCKREFRSAQALGGHMNVHRRDRARLRQSSPPWVNPPPFSTNPNPNPNASHAHVPNLNLSPPPTPSSTTEAKQHQSPELYTFTSLLSPLHRMPSLMAFPVGPFRSKNTKEEDDLQVGKTVAPRIIGRGAVEEDLDLELRLGYTNYM